MCFQALLIMFSIFSLWILQIKLFSYNEPSKSPFGAPVFFVKKSDGSLRLVCDWRELNRITIKNEACLPNTDDLFATIQGSKFFTKLDLHSGYSCACSRVRYSKAWRLSTFPSDIFSTRWWDSDATATFTSLMNHVLRPHLQKFVVVFVDDILIFSQSWEEHLIHLQTVLQALRDHELYCKPSKCAIGSSEVLYLGHLLTGETISSDPAKFQVVTDWPRPQTVSQVWSFLGFANYLRRFIQRYAEIARPLDEVTGKRSTFSWNQEKESAFEDL